MATVTPNFNWPVPTSTDLVKDGATAIEALGDSIDASLVDLKGGTTGQVLSKNSNTDMDFVWVTDAAGDIQGVTVTSPLTGGGTSGTVTVGILSGTTSNLGAVQLSDSTSSTSTSLAATANAVKQAYDPAFTNNFYAAKNKVINGNFGVWQRGTTFTNPGNVGAYTADRYTVAQNAAITSHTVSQQSFTLGAAPVAGYESQFFYRSLITTPGSCTVLNIQNRIEDVRTFAGQTVSISFWAKADTTRTISLDYYQNFGSGGSGTVSATLFASTNLTTSWVRYTGSIAIPSISGKTIGTGSYLAVVFNQAVAAGSTLDIWGVQLEAGSAASPFQTSTGTLQGELAACQRYYVRLGAANGLTTAAYATYGNGYTTSTTNATIPVQLPVTMRVAPTSVDFSSLAIINTSSTLIAVSAVAINSSNNSNNRAHVETTVTGATANVYQTLENNNSTSGYIGFSAEL